MAEPTLAGFLRLVQGRRGHFRLESGYHGALWLDLDDLFAEPRALAPFVARLASQLRAHAPEVVCGPLIGGAFLAQLVAQALDVEFCFTERRMPAQAEGLYRAQYVLPPACRSRVAGRRIAVVDDVISAGSALRGTCLELEAQGAATVVAGALLVLGDAAIRFLNERHVSLEAVARENYEMWAPAECPLCAAGHPLEDLSSP